jgi:DNA-3-methyladenine glycosylase
MRFEEVLEKPAIEAAPLLLGCKLTRHTPKGDIALRIVETEAYHQDDPASHSFRGLTARTAPMFETGGTVYVYFTYGMHYCMNLVVGPKGVGEGVLLRAGEPLAGIDLMQKHRKTTDVHKLASGPGRFAQALGITDTQFSGKTLQETGFTLEPPSKVLGIDDIVVGPRIGIRQAIGNPWRFYIKDSRFISRR